MEKGLHCIREYTVVCPYKRWCYTSSIPNSNNDSLLRALHFLLRLLCDVVMQWKRSQRACANKYKHSKAIQGEDEDACVVLKHVLIIPFVRPCRCRYRKGRYSTVQYICELQSCCRCPTVVEQVCLCTALSFPASPLLYPFSPFSLLFM